MNHIDFQSDDDLRHIVACSVTEKDDFSVYYICFTSHVNNENNEQCYYIGMLAIHNLSFVRFEETQWFLS